jgi:hypothetical protein
VRTGRVFALLAALVAALPAGAAPFQHAEYQIRGFKGPVSLIAGLSGTYELTIVNFGSKSGSLELIIIFIGAIDQTDQVIAPGLDCEVRHDTGINAAVRCTKPVFEPDEELSVIVQGRGQAAGAGKIGAVLNPTRTAEEDDYDNNNSTLAITIR